jgi:protein-S-isoprenylcysteine O-methyltransferase Ste14
LIRAAAFLARRIHWNKITVISMMNRSQRGGWWVFGQSVLMTAAVGAGVGWHDQWHSVIVFGIGMGLLVAAGVVGVLGVIHLGKNRTAYPRPLANSKLVQTGVYGLMRHPLYTSVVVATLGWGLVWASGPSVILAVALGVYFDAKARSEERWLRERFPAYADYARRVKRFIPGLY